MVDRYVIATIKSWNIENAKKLAERYDDAEFVLVTDKDSLTRERLDEIAPRYVFFPHWSWIIPKDIYSAYECVVFHMTDLPFGRGGSPLQNLLVRGIYDTKVSAIRVDGGIDTGSIYCKEPFNISEGNVNEIMKGISALIFEKMIPLIMEKHPVPMPQTGEVVEFKRRRPEESEIPDGLSTRQLYDYIRMLDGEGYPVAYTRYGGGRIEYRDAHLTDRGLTARIDYSLEHERGGR